MKTQIIFLTLCATFLPVKLSITADNEGKTSVPFRWEDCAWIPFLGIGEAGPLRSDEEEREHWEAVVYLNRERRKKERATQTASGFLSRLDEYESTPVSLKK